MRSNEDELVIFLTFMFYLDASCECLSKLN